ncbi:MAG TPA: hypothetical protein VK470_03725 [Bacteroidota bacterium]|nr:hypothetical protein [Bacteroidota bacterium]
MQLTRSGLKSSLTAIGIGAVIMLGIVVLSHRLIAQYTGTGNHVIALSDAQKFIQNYWSNPVAPANKAVYFERNIYDKILAQPGCVGIRQYFATTDGKNVTLVLVGVDANGSDLIHGTIGELAQPCPPLCAPGNKLY